MKWLQRDLIVGPYLALALSDKQFQKAISHLKIAPADRPAWVTEGCDATAHSFMNPDGNLACVVCLRVAPGISSIQIASLLVHESVHVWQRFKDSIGETSPSREFEAYAIQAIAQRLMKAYADSLAGPL